jgi:hypothetical protein
MPLNYPALIRQLSGQWLAAGGLAVLIRERDGTNLSQKMIGDGHYGKSCWRVGGKGDKLQRLKATNIVDQYHKDVAIWATKSMWQQNLDQAIPCLFAVKDPTMICLSSNVRQPPSISTNTTIN